MVETLRPVSALEPTSLLPKKKPLSLVPIMSKELMEEFGEIWGASHDRVVTYVFRRVGDRMLAEDLASEVFMAALKAFPSYEDRNLPFGAWLFKIAHNKVIDHRRRRSTKNEAFHVSVEDVESLLIDDREDNDPVEALDRKMDLELVMGAINQAGLTGYQRRVIVARYLKEMSIVEIAEDMGKKPGAIKIAAFQGLKKIRACLISSNF